MIFSYYLKKLPYSLIWLLTGFFQKRKAIVIYCGELLDWYVLKFLADNLPDVTVIAKNNRVRKQLQDIGVHAEIHWTFPQLVIMARHSFYKFPCKKILKIGMRHGPYHFKKMIDVKKYNLFDLYLFTSDYELEQAERSGIRSGAAGGYPKLDPAFDGTITAEEIIQLRKILNFDERPVIIFSATWERSGLSAIDKWSDRIEELTDNYNVMVTLHPWIEPSLREKIDQTKGVFLIKSHDILPYLLLADLLVGDTSSILAEFCALKKPMITFKVKMQKRLDEELSGIISKISLQINEFDQLIPSIQYLLQNRDILSDAQTEANRKMFLPLDGHHKDRCLDLINEFLKLNGLCSADR